MRCQQSWRHYQQPCLPARDRGKGILLDVEGDEGQVQDESDPVTIDQEKEGQESVDDGFGDDVGVEAVA